MKFFAALCALFLCVVAAPADNCRARVVQRVQHVQQVAAVEYAAAAAVYVPLVVTVPAYGAGYSAGYEQLFGRGQPQQPAPAQADPTLQQLLLEVQKIRAEVEAIKRGNPGGGEPVPVPPNKIEPLPPLPEKSKISQAAPHLKVLTTHCIMCHEASVVGKKGPGLGTDFVMFNGPDLVKFSAEQLLAVSTRMYAGEMPPPKEGRCSDQEIHEVMVWLRSLSKKGFVKADRDAPVGGPFPHEK